MWDEVTDPLHHPEHGAVQGTAIQIAKQILSRRSLTSRAAIANPVWFALSSVSGLRLVPSEQAPRFGRASAHPGIRVSHLHHLRLRSYDGHAPVFAGDISNRPTLRKIKNPPERWLGRVRVKRIVDIALGEIAPMSRACTIDRPIAVQ